MTRWAVSLSLVSAAGAVLGAPWPFTLACYAGSVALWVAVARRWWRKWLRVDELIREDAEPLPWRLPVTPAELAALNGEADLQAEIDTTPLKHMEAF